MTIIHSCEVWIERTEQCPITHVAENPLNEQRNLCYFYRDSHPEHIQKYTTGQDLKGKGYDFRDFTLDCFPKLTAGIEGKARMIAGMINHSPELRLHWRNRDARNRLWRIRLTVYSEESKFVKWTLFYQIKKKETAMRTYSLVSTNAQEWNQCFVLYLRSGTWHSEWHLALGEHNKKKIAEEIYTSLTLLPRDITKFHLKTVINSYLHVCKK